jgi:predicted O-methyltransferase YrrM
VLESFLPLVERLAAIPLDTTDPVEPCWHNGWFQGLDATALYCLLATTRPKRYIEVGSGNSTRFARRAVSDHGLATTIWSIDPQPRVEVDGLCDRVIRQPFETVDLAMYEELEAGDICFFDGSHRSFENSDATVGLVEVLPRLAPGVLVHVHDIFLPWDYPPQLSAQYWSEQYLLATLLLSGGDLVEVVLPNFYACITPPLHRVLAPLWDRFTWSATPTNGLSMWLRRVGPARR